MAKDKKNKWANITSDYVGTPYKLGGQYKEDGMDCFSLMVKVMEDMDVEMDLSEFEGMTLDTYKDFFEKNPTETKEAMLRWLQTFTTKIENKDMRPGDILIAESKSIKQMFGAIYCGNSRVMAASEQGVKIYKLEYFNILETYRCQKGGK